MHNTYTIYQILKIGIFSFILMSINTVNAQTDAIQTQTKSTEYTYITVSGKITDESGMPLPFANVFQRNVCVGTTSGIDGNYSVRFDPSFPISAEMAFSYSSFCDVRVNLNDYDISKNIILNIVMDTKCEFSEYYYFQDPPSGRTLPKLIRDWLQNLKRKQNETAPAPIENTQVIRKETPNIRPTKIGTKKLITNIFPNPFDHKIQLTLDSEVIENLRVVLYDSMSREIHSEEINVWVGTNEIKLDLKEKQITNGSYFLSIFRENEIIQTEILTRM